MTDGADSERTTGTGMLHAEQRYRNIVEHATEGIFQASPDGRFLSANPALARLHGYSSPVELMETVRDISRQLFVDPVRYTEMVRLLTEHDVLPNFEARMRRKDGDVRWVSMNVRTVRDERGTILFHEGTMRDITKRKETEEALAESEERYRTVIENSNDGIAIIHEGRHLYVNRRFVEMFGYRTMDDIAGKPISQIVHPDDRERVLDVHKRRATGEPVPPRYEFRGITRDGGTLHVEVSATGVTYRNLPVILVFLRDVTERKRAEEVLLQSHRQLEQLNRAKTKAVNHISHELKTPLSVIQGNIRLLRRRLEDTRFDSKMQAIIETVEKHVGRLLEMQREADEILRISRRVEFANLVDELDRLRERVEDLSQVPPDIDTSWESLRKWVRDHTSDNTQTLQPVDPYPALMRAAEKARRLAGRRKVDVRVKGAKGLSILMDPTILRDVIDGLVRNAIENTPDGGSVELSVEEKGERVLVHVTDDGVGITEEDQAYIFDGLFHAKDTELYASKQPYDFDAGGKGLDLLRMKVYAEHFGFDLSVKSTRCRFLPADGDVCPGDIARCSLAKTAEECRRSGGTTFTVSFVRSSNREMPESAAT